jgi:hypothetical protein
MLKYYKEKLAQMVRVGVACPPPFTICNYTYKVAVDAPAVWEDTLTLFHLYQYMYSVGEHIQELYTVYLTIPSLQNCLAPQTKRGPQKNEHLPPSTFTGKILRKSDI